MKKNTMPPSGTTRSPWALFIRALDIKSVSRPILLIGLVIALLFPATIHVYMLSVLRIPYPDSSHEPGWVHQLISACSILGVALFFQLARRKISNLSISGQCVLVSVIFSMIQQEILRIIMGGVFTTAFAYNFLAEIPHLIYVFSSGVLVVLVINYSKSAMGKAAGAVAVAGVMTFAVYPLLKWIYAPFLVSIAHLDHATVYGLPLGPHILVPAYILTSEAVIGCTVLTALIWQSLSPTLAIKLAQLTFIIMLINGVALRGTLEPFFLPFSLAASFLSASQFFMEWIALSVTIGLSWHAAQRFRS
jgi:hypothetical protein